MLLEAGNAAQRGSPVAILGTGPFAQGLAALALRSGACFGRNVRIGSRRQPDGAVGSLPGLEGIDVMSVGEALAGAGIVVLATPAHTHPHLVREHGAALAGKVVVDVCNPPASRSGSAWPEPSPPSGADLEKGLGPALDKAGSGSQASDSSPRSGLDGGGAAAAAAAHAEGLAAALSGRCAVVKGLNGLSARAMLDAAAPAGPRLSTPLAGDSPAALAAVATFLSQLNVDARVVPSLRYAREMEQAQRACLPAWRLPALLAAAVLAVCYTYTVVRYAGLHWTWWDLLLLALNKALAWAALTLLAFVFLPGVLAGLDQYARRRSLAGPGRLPRWLGAWLGWRKQLGLLAAGLVALHALISCLLFMPANFSKFFVKQSALALATSAGTALNDFGVPKALPALPGPYALLSNATAPGTLVAAAGAAGAGTAGAAAGAPQAMLLAAKFIGAGSRLAWGGEMCLLLGVLAAAALALPALTSLPGVGAALTWREWRLLQGWAGSAALVLATVHVLLLGLPNNGWTDSSKWPWGMPPITILSVVAPLAVVAGWAALAVLRALRAATLRCAPVLWRAPGGGGLDGVALYAAH